MSYVQLGVVYAKAKTSVDLNGPITILKATHTPPNLHSQTPLKASGTINPVVCLEEWIGEGRRDIVMTPLHSMEFTLAIIDGNEND